jgi:hypothetical protein
LIQTLFQLTNNQNDKLQPLRWNPHRDGLW